MAKESNLVTKYINSQGKNTHQGVAELWKGWNLYRGNWEVTYELAEVHFKAVLQAGGAQVQWVRVWLESDYS